MLLHGMISPEDLELFHLTDDVEDAASEIERFYRVYHSQRHLGDKLLLRLQRPLPEPVLEEIERHSSRTSSAGRWSRQRGR